MPVASFCQVPSSCALSRLTVCGLTSLLSAIDRRPGAKMRINRGQEFVIGGYTVGGKNFDAVIFGCYEAGRLQ